MTIDEELEALLLMSSHPPSWEMFITTICDASATAIKYFEVTSSILFKGTQRKTFIHELASDAFMMQSLGDRPNNWGRSFSKVLINSRSLCKFRDI